MFLHLSWLVVVRLDHFVPHWRRSALIATDLALVQLHLCCELLLRLVDGMHVASLRLVDHFVWRLLLHRQLRGALGLLLRMPLA